MDRESFFHTSLSHSMLNFLIHKSTHSPVVIVDDKENIINCNLPMEKLWECDTQQLLGQTLGHFVAMGTSLERIYQVYFRNFSEKLLLPPIIVHTAKSKLTSSNYTVFRIENEGRFVYAIIFSDLGAVSGLNLLQQFAGTFMRDVNLGVILVDTEFILVDISDMACKILGVQREEALNKPMEEVFASVPNEHRLVQRTILDGVVVRNHAVSWTNNRERFELLIDSNLLKDSIGNIVGAYVIFKDVTNLRSLEEQVQRSDRLAMIGQIAAGTAHEIRNPLTSIKGFLQVLKKTFKNSEMEKEYGYTEVMLTEIDRINELVNEFLLLSKAKNVTYEPVDVSTVLREILPIINNEAILHNVTVQYESAIQLPRVVADRELLKQVFLNICKNGIEAMVEGGILSITERRGSEEKRVSIEIHDTGPGIPVFLIDKIFDPFFTTKDEGTGLGLSVCQRIIHDLGGNIRVSSKGFGTTFNVSIPFFEN